MTSMGLTITGLGLLLAANCTTTRNLSTSEEQAGGSSAGQGSDD